MPESVFDKPLYILSQIRIKVVVNVSRSIYIVFNLDDKPFDEVTAVIWNNKIYINLLQPHIDSSEEPKMQHF